LARSPSAGWFAAEIYTFPPPNAARIARPHEASAEEIATFAGVLEAMKHGWAVTFEQLESYLASL
jgi:hypothetical protein